MMLAILGLANYILLVSLITFLQSFSVRRLYHSLGEKFLGLCTVIIPIGAVVVCLAALPEALIFMSSLKVKEPLET